VPLYKQRQIFAAISIAVPSFRATTEKKELIFTVLKDGRVRIETYLNSNDMEIDSLLASTS
jgi:DNA-binding IclR family transcriptional regulator